MLKIFTPIVILIAVTLSLLILEERKTFDLTTLVQIDPIPHTKELIKKKKYVEAEEYLSFFMKQAYVENNPESNRLLQLIRNKRNSYSYKTEKFLEGIVQGGSDEEIGKISAIASDFLLIGDIRDLSIEGMHYANDQKVDNFIVALSSLGVLATATTIYSLGATTPVKSSLSLLKYGKKLNKIPSWLQQEIIRYAKIAKETNSLDKLNNLVEPISKIYKKVGLNQTLTLLKSSRNLKELTSLANFSSRFKKSSPILLAITHNKALPYANAMPKVSNESFMIASTYGENGLKGLHRLGEHKFLKRVGFYAHLGKTTYKGNLNSLINWVLKNIPTYLLFGTVFLGLFYFIAKFFRVFQGFASELKVF